MHIHSLKHFYFDLQVIESWEKFITHSTTMNPNEQAQNPDIAYFVVEYFEKYYIGALGEDGKRKKARFEIPLWNVHGSTVTGKQHRQDLVTLDQIPSLCLLEKISLYIYNRLCTKQ